MAAARKPAAAQRPRPKLVEIGPDHFQVVYPVFRYRVLLSSGRVVEVDAYRDDSDMRGLIVGDGPDGAHAIPGSAGASIAGIATVEHIGWTEDPEAF